MMITVIASILILGILQMSYSQTYEVTFNGEVIGYTNDKVVLQKKINDYISTGDGEDIAFVELDELPTYKAVLLKRNVELNDDEIFEKVVSAGTAYYKYYAITVANEEKQYVKTFSEAEEIVDTLKKKNSSNVKELGIVEKFATKDVSEQDTDGGIEDNTEIKLASVDDAVKDLYEVKATVKKASSTSAYQNIGTKIDSSQTKVSTNLGISLVKPISSGYTISSRFGYRSRDNHKGLDIAAPRGTAIKAAAGGKVTFAGSGSPYGGYGNIVVIQCTSSVSMRYAHCSKIYVKSGQTVSQGQVIAAVGSTGISTGNHLHFEIRINGTAVNPQKYLY